MLISQRVGLVQYIAPRALSSPATVHAAKVDTIWPIIAASSVRLAYY